MKEQLVESAWCLALVMVMQYSEGLTDRQAAEMIGIVEVSRQQVGEKPY